MSQPTATPKPLLDQLEERYLKLREKDRSIRKYDREIQRQADKMRYCYAMRKIARIAQRKHEDWLREEAAAQIRKEQGIQTIPGFASRRESAIQFRMNLNARHKAATAAAKQVLNSPPASPPA